MDIMYASTLAHGPPTRLHISLVDCHYCRKQPTEKICVLPTPSGIIRILIYSHVYKLC